MKVGQLTWGHLGCRATMGNSDGGFISGKLTSIEYAWGELFMGKMVMKGSLSDGLRLTIGSWPIVVGYEDEIEVIK